ncbi:hypothetical protein IMZ31_21890 (plasmid) [Pontibacillus sp. ALD_SL1]|uniref:hypothetical protein n=1 Tax=Pontibacillus sp. ALD_SL1 TaxID=2777185 RepID=UPI001A96EE24|nr:hypothetical protein [Pontibacillus sp. ALD_SL1]QST02105.1 hypothetical protein IMZ31_21890 [Pontibacillus sp. ALD_SL1]
MPNNIKTSGRISILLSFVFRYYIEKQKNVFEKGGFTMGLPERIGSFEQISEQTGPILDDRASYIDHYKHVKKGSLEEILASYDDGTYQYSVRVSGRGEKLELRFLKMELVYDHTGPLSAEILEERVFPPGKGREALYYLLDRVELHVLTKKNLNQD